MKTTRVMKVNPKRIQELKAKIERDPLNVNLYMMLASQLEADGKRRQALSVLEKAVGKARRNLGVTYCSYAAMLMSAGQPQLALQNFDTAVEIDPANASFYLSNKAQVLNKIGLNDKAMAVFDQVLEQPNVSKETRRIAIRGIKDLKKK